MMSKIKYLMLVLGFISVFGLSFIPMTAGAAGILDEQCTPPITDVNKDLCAKNKESLTSFIKPLVNTALFILGAVSVVMIILGGIKYTTSTGDTKNVESAKNTILYAVIGLVVALLAYAIVNFVLGIFSTPAAGPTTTSVPGGSITGSSGL